MKNLVASVAAHVPSEASSHTLAVAQKGASGAAIGGTGLVLLVLAVTMWYCFKHKGYDWPQVLMGIALTITLQATPWGSPIVAGLGQMLNGTIGAFISGFSAVA